MANTCTTIHIHSIFAVQNRILLTISKWESRLYQLITGIIQNYGHILLVISGAADHVHVLIGMRPTQSLPELVKQIKDDTSFWINKERLCSKLLLWQENYGASLCSNSQISNVIRYISNQKQHHPKKSFEAEYPEFLEEFQIDDNPSYCLK